MIRRRCVPRATIGIGRDDRSVARTIALRSHRSKGVIGAGAPGLPVQCGITLADKPPVAPDVVIYLSNELGRS